MNSALMKTTFFILLFCAFVSGHLLFAQPTQYDWDQYAEHKLTEEEKELPEIILERHFIYEYQYEAEDGPLLQYRTFHLKVRANNASAIEDNNRIYISMNNVQEIVELKARTISPSGKIQELDKTNIKELKDEEGKGYQIFAIEGAEEGGIIE